jgi:cation:H+ antiporter
MSDLALSVVFVVGVAVSLGASWVLVTTLERVGARLGLTEALLGMLAALAADAPEITSAAAALARGQHAVGVGVVLGSNVFNLAALLGLGAVVAGQIALHRRVVALEGAVGLWTAAVSICALAGLIGPKTGLVLVLLVLLPYAWLSALRAPHRTRVRIPPRVRRWLAEALREEEQEEGPALHPAPGRPSDAVSAVTGAIALVVVVVASVAMEHAATTLGTRLAVPGIVTGGIVLAAITSLPNAVTAVYLARRGRGAATLSEAMNSNTLNVAFGLFLPAAIAGLATGGSAALVATWYAAMTLAVLGLAYAGRGLSRLTGTLVIAAYLAFVAVLVATA